MKPYNLYTFISECHRTSNRYCKGELHSDDIFLHFVLINLEWGSIIIFTKMNFFSSKIHISAPFAQDIYGLLFINMNIF